MLGQFRNHVGTSLGRFAIRDAERVLKDACAGPKLRGAVEEVFRQSGFLVMVQSAVSTVAGAGVDDAALLDSGRAAGKCFRPESASVDSVPLLSCFALKICSDLRSAVT